MLLASSTEVPCFTRLFSNANGKTKSRNLSLFRELISCKYVVCVSFPHKIPKKDKKTKVKNKTLSDFFILNSNNHLLLQLYHSMNKKSISNPKFDNELEKKIRKFKNFFTGTICVLESYYIKSINT